MTLPVRRLVAALALGAALLTAGCGSLETDRAATVDGRVITETEVNSVMEQINAMDPSPVQNPLTPGAALTQLVRSAPALEFFAENGLVSSESLARTQARDGGLDDPSDATIEILRYFHALNVASSGQQFTQEDQAEFFQRISSQEVDVSPRYGAFDPETLAVTATTPEWVEPFAAPQ
ncbi:hypothetical protein [Phycicoccus sp. CSK15P-2]|uniref:hypothetical protein n=1 Tax=Phycicoccus sp. CSK15P-2 TaxID=2807627 RepID=UPI001EF2EBC8|nr:hypothetical protein [Phycicoccus sp. CSK15P-2]